jgi:signal transduction histidine kinase
LASLAARLGHGEVTYGYLIVSLAHGQVADFEEQTLLARMADDLGFALHNMAMRQAKEAAEAAREGLEARLLQAQKMEAVGRLAGGVAHDFNNMLSVISGYAELATQEVEADSPLAQDLGEIARAARRSTELTRQLLAFARRQAGQPRVVVLNDIISDSERMLRRLVGEDIEIRFTPRPGSGRCASIPRRWTRSWLTSRSMPAMPSPTWAASRSPPRTFPSVKTRRASGAHRRRGNMFGSNSEIPAWAWIKKR